MPLLDSALAFAITMLALSLTCSAIVELIHRIFKMRQAGFKYMLDQMFDQVLSKYVEPALKAKVAAGTVLKNGTVEKELEAVKTAFVDRMRANRAPMGVKPNATPVDAATKVADNKSVRLGLWGGRELTELSPVDFMERLGTMDIGTTIADGVAETSVSFDAALKDIAQKFEALGKDAADYFDGRARLLSVFVAVVFAFVVHADAVDLYTTYLQNPNATAAVIAKSEAITKQFEATTKAEGKNPSAGENAAAQAGAKKQAADAQNAAAQADAKKQAADAQNAAAQADAKKQAADAQNAAAQADANKQAADAQNVAPQTDAKKQPADAQNAAAKEDGKNQVEEVQKAAKDLKDQTQKMIKEFADLGVPLGWTDKRYEAADLWVWVWSCKKVADENWLPWLTLWRTCKSDVAPAKDGNKGTPAAVTDGTAAKDGTTADDRLKALNLKYTNIWFGIPLNLSVLFYLVLGGLLIGLGAPFWFNVVTTITNLRGGGSGATRAASGLSAPPATMAMAVSSQRAQPATPVSAFLVASDARPLDSSTSGGTKTAASSP
jgi:hypothetical protein